MIVTIIAMHLAALQAKLVEPGMQSFRGVFLTPNFFAVRLQFRPVIIPSDVEPAVTVGDDRGRHGLRPVHRFRLCR